MSSLIKRQKLRPLTNFGMRRRVLGPRNRQKIILKIRSKIFFQKLLNFSNKKPVKIYGIC